MTSSGTNKTTKRTYTEKDILSAMMSDGITRKPRIRKHHNQIVRTLGTEASCAGRATTALPPMEQPIAPTVQAAPDTAPVAATPEPAKPEPP